MAKKRKKTDQEREEREYQPPEFDEREFLHEEINVARATILAAILAIPMGAVAYFVMLYAGTGGGLIAGVIGIYLIKIFMPFFRVEEALVKPKHWLGLISTYFFAFLAVWILIVNPPFADLAGPQVLNLDVMVELPDGTITNYTIIDNGLVNFTQIDVEARVNISIRAEITDNTQLDISTVTITVGSGATVSMTHEANTGDFIYEQDNLALVEIRIDSMDVKGNNNSFTFTLV